MNNQSLPPVDARKHGAEIHLVELLQVALVELAQLVRNRRLRAGAVIRIDEPQLVRDGAPLLLS